MPKLKVCVVQIRIQGESKKETSTLQACTRVGIYAPTAIANTSGIAAYYINNLTITTRIYSSASANAAKVRNGYATQATPCQEQEDEVEYDVSQENENKPYDCRNNGISCSLHTALITTRGNPPDAAIHEEA